MSSTPQLKIFNPRGEYIGCVKHYEDSACLVASYGAGATVRFGHSKRHTLWSEGAEAFSAGESYDQAAIVMRDRESAMWNRAASKAGGPEHG